MHNGKKSDKQEFFSNKEIVMNLKEYACNSENKIMSEDEKAHNTWKIRANEACNQLIDYISDYLKKQIDLINKTKGRRCIRGPVIKIVYEKDKKRKYDKEYPRFNGYSSGWKCDYDIFYEYISIAVNNNEEATYCKDSIIKRLENEGIITKCSKTRFFDYDKGYFINYTFKW